MFAFKCDRCGRLYEAGTKPYRNVNDHLFLNRRINGKENMTDLCPECIKSLERWFYDYLDPSDQFKKFDLNGPLEREYNERT